MPFLPEEESNHFLVMASQHLQQGRTPRTRSIEYLCREDPTPDRHLAKKLRKTVRDKGKNERETRSLKWHQYQQQAQIANLEEDHEKLQEEHKKKLSESADKIKEAKELAGSMQTQMQGCLLRRCAHLQCVEQAKQAIERAIDDQRNGVSTTSDTDTDSDSASSFD